jgi:hypothetical protein
MFVLNFHLRLSEHETLSLSVCDIRSHRTNQIVFGKYVSFFAYYCCLHCNVVMASVAGFRFVIHFKIKFFHFLYNLLLYYHMLYLLILYVVIIQCYDILGHILQTKPLLDTGQTMVNEMSR